MKRIAAERVEDRDAPVSRAAVPEGDGDQEEGKI